MSAPTLWEEGRWSGTRVTRFSLFACIVLVGVDLIFSNDLGTVFDIGFVLLCLAMALVVHPADFFRVGVLPPLLLLGVSVLLALVDRGAIASSGDSYVQAVIAGLAHHAGPLLVGYALALGVLAIRSRVLSRRETAQHRSGHSNRDGSPAPTRVTSGAPDVKSTTVVGNDPHSPESITASTT